jgi:hypothetical protein
VRRYPFTETYVLPKINRSVVGDRREGTDRWLELFDPLLWLAEMPLSSRFYGRVNMMLDGMVFATAGPVYVANDGLGSLSLLVDHKLVDAVLAAERIELVFTGEALEFEDDEPDRSLGTDTVRAVFRLVS